MASKMEIMTKYTAGLGKSHHMIVFCSPVVVVMVKVQLYSNPLYFVSGKRPSHVNKMSKGMIVGILDPNKKR